MTSGDSSPGSAADDRHGIQPPNETRAERLARIRSMIERGEYDTPERWDEALSRMCARVDLFS